MPDALHFVPQFLCVEADIGTLSAEVVDALCVAVQREDDDQTQPRKAKVESAVHGSREVPHGQLLQLTEDALDPTDLLGSGQRTARAYFRNEQAAMIADVSNIDLALVKAGLGSSRGDRFWAGCRHHDTSLSPVKPTAKRMRQASREGSPEAMTPALRLPTFAPTPASRGARTSTPVSGFVERRHYGAHLRPEVY